MARPAHADDGYKLLDIDGHMVKWGAPHLGLGAVVTYRISFARATAAGRDNCRQTAGLDALLANAGIGREELLRAADAAFALWSDVADIRFAPAARGQTADITLTAEAGEYDGIAYSDVTPANSKHSVAALSAAVVCLNPQASWTAAAAAPNGVYRLTYVLAHEIGHTLGLDHPSPTGALMSFEYDPMRAGLTPGDAAGAIFLYGPARRRLVSNR